MNIAEPSVWSAKCSERYACASLIFDRIHRIQAVMSHLIFDQKNLSEIRFTVSATTGCARSCRVSKTARWLVVGARGRSESAEVSQIICVSEVGTGRYVNLPVAYPGDDWSYVPRRDCSKAISWRSISEGNDRELVERRDKALAATSCSPEIYWISQVNCQTKSKGWVSRGEYLSGLECSANVSERWSV